MKPILRNGKWYCGKCGGYIDTGFIDEPSHCENYGCGVLLDWS